MAKRKNKNINRKSKGDVTPEFKKLVKKIMNEHDDVLRELAKRIK